MSDVEEQKSGVSRRTVAKAMAWSVPAVALAAPAPAYAARPPCVPTLTFTDDSCRCPGQSDSGFEFTYFLTFCVTFPGACPPDSDTVTILEVASKTGGPGGTPLVPVAPTELPIVIPATGCDDTVYQFGSTNSSVNLLITLNWDGNTEVVEADAPVQECPNCEGAPTAG
jgi:hypothetical protein